MALRDLGSSPSVFGRAEPHEGLPALPALPSGWSEHIDPASGNRYYYNAGTGDNSWTPPTNWQQAALPPIMPYTMNYDSAPAGNARTDSTIYPFKPRSRSCIKQMMTNYGINTTLIGVGLWFGVSLACLVYGAVELENAANSEYVKTDCFALGWDGPHENCPEDSACSYSCNYKMTTDLSGSEKFEATGSATEDACTEFTCSSVPPYPCTAVCEVIRRDGEYSGVTFNGQAHDIGWYLGMVCIGSIMTCGGCHCAHKYSHEAGWRGQS